jgi:hypothetical protein
MGLDDEAVTTAKKILECGINTYFNHDKEDSFLIDTYHKYTFKSRGFSPGCQPMKGFVTAKVEADYEFEVLYYNRKLTADEISTYELIDLN